MAIPDAKATARKTKRKVAIASPMRLPCIYVFLSPIGLQTSLLKASFISTDMES